MSPSHDVKTVEEYLASVPEERRGAMTAIRQMILENLPPGYEETMTWGMPGYEVPLERYPDTYNKKPLMYAAFASQKNYMAVYVTLPYWDDALMQDFLSRYKASGKKLDMGKSCIRFKKIDDLALDVIADLIKSHSVDEFIKLYEEMRK